MSADEYQHWRAHGGHFDLSRRAKFRLSGADRVRYLNGQVTANVTKLGLEDTIPACVTTAKGKLNAEVFLTATDTVLYLDAEPELRESLHARLERYIVADDVLLEDVTDTYLLWHFAGPEDAARAWAARLPPGAIPRHAHRARRFGPLGWDLLVPHEPMPQSGSDPAPGRAPSGLPLELAEAIRLEAGLPRWGHELTEDTLPPEAGLDRTHIDYAKGCYIGQEVISRLKSVGHVNRRLSGFIAAGEEPLAAGWLLYAPGEAEKPVGELTSAGWSFALAKPIALGYLRRQAPSGALLARPAGGGASPVEVTPAELPLVTHFP